MEQVRDLLNRAILYRVKEGALLGQLAPLLSKQETVPEALNLLLAEAVRQGWQGNLWQHVLTQSLVESENPFSLLCERRKAPEDSLKALALRDMIIYRQLFDMDGEMPEWKTVTAFSCEMAPPSELSDRLMNLSCELAAATEPEAMLEALCGFYEENGLGMLGMGRIFRVNARGDKAELFPLEKVRSIRLQDLVGYTEQKKQLMDNTASFLRGNHANNVLLYGDAGTGKSTSIQALSTEFGGQGLRIVEMYKHQFQAIPDLLSQLKNRNYRFILLLDDLSFEEDELEYKYLKAVMEGGAEAAPENVRIYATSNRRHLVRETWKDRNDIEHDGDIHRSDTMEEKLSLAARFGLQIFYPAPTFEEYHAIVSFLAARDVHSEGLSAEELRKLASTWQVRHGSRSGRTAQQFVDSLSSRES